MNPNFHYSNGFSPDVEHLVMQVSTKYPYPAVEIRRRGRTNNWNIFMILEQSKSYTGNLLHGKAVTNADPTAAMLEAVTIASKYISEKAAALDSLLK